MCSFIPYNLKENYFTITRSRPSCVMRLKHFFPRLFSGGILIFSSFNNKFHTKHMPNILAKIKFGSEIERVFSDLHRHRRRWRARGFAQTRPSRGLRSSPAQPQCRPLAAPASTAPTASSAETAFSASTAPGSAVWFCSAARFPTLQPHRIHNSLY